jgi:hypothetical protein
MSGKCHRADESSLVENEAESFMSLAHRCPITQAKGPRGPSSHQSEASAVDLYRMASEGSLWKHDPDPTIDVFFSGLLGGLGSVDRNSPEISDLTRGVPPVNVFVHLSPANIGRTAIYR